MNVESADVIRLIQQFLKEHNLHKTLETLQSESGVSLNTVDNIDKFKDDIIKGRWDVVLTTVAHANIPNEHLIDLYEQIIMELVETQDLSAARALLRQTEPMEIMRRKQPDRYLAMEHLISRVTTDGPSGYSDSMSGGKEERRRKISEQLIRHVSTAPPSRLLTLLAQAVKWEQEKQGLVVPKDIPFDLFHGKSTQPLMAGDDRIPNKQISTVKFPKKQHPGCLALSSKNSYLATGSMDGFIEIWDSMTGKLAPSLQYQKDGALMMMEGAITSLAFSHSGDLICSGAKDGKIKIWKTASGTSHKKLPAAHTQEVTCVAFSADDSQVLSGSYTGALRIHGLKSGNMLKELRGHSAAITGAIFCSEEDKVVSCSEDGTVRVWDTRSTTCLHSVVPRAQKEIGLSAPAINSVTAIPGKPDLFLVCARSPALYIMTVEGQVERVIQLPTSQCKEFLAAAVSPQGKYAMAVSDSSVLHCFDLQTGMPLNDGHVVADVEVLGLAAHPSLNMVAFFGNDRRIPIWASL